MINPVTPNFHDPNPSYEDTVIFMISNFQYITACLAFSVSKPFRQPVWTNVPFIICVILLVMFDTILVLAADNSLISKWFTLLPFETDDGTSYYDYRAWIVAGILLNILMTFGVERLITGVITVRADYNRV